ncbi:MULTISPECIES: cupin domain-containing protein [unclassified Romboutsia]|uniref:cupin domain-containing protein n=1 Tax=unclassified Romboutsia TaxID=2626894 RepID=UPI0008230C93|nr:MULTISPECIES: cupin domain-containing protein [unclassified Romboutsia]SCH70081.1 Uncharacterised protein [uncultured Clostridium sp.]
MYYNLIRLYNYYSNSQIYNRYPYFAWSNPQMFYMYQNNLWNEREIDQPNTEKNSIKLSDYGPEPLVVNLENAAEKNNRFRTVIWTGNNLQIVLMSIPVSYSVDPYLTKTSDQFIHTSSGTGLIKIGTSQNELDYQTYINKNSSVIIPSCKWVTILNLGNVPLKLYITYAPPEFANNTMHETKTDSLKK